MIQRKAGAKSGRGVKAVTSSLSQKWFLWILSLLFAAILWLFVGGENRIDKNIIVPVEIINLPQELAISNQYKKELEVSVSGSRSVLKEMDEIIRLIDLTGSVAGTKVVRNLAGDIRVPRGVTVQRIQPPTILLSLDTLVNKQVPIKLRTVGKVTKGFYVQSKVAVPGSITISGSQTNLSDVKTLRTEPIDLAGLKESKQLQVPLELTSELVNLIGETSVTADLDIRPIAEKVTIEGLAIQATIAGDDVEVEPAIATIVAAIPEGYIKDRTAPASLVQVKADGKEGESRLAVKAVQRDGLPLPIYIESVTPEFVQVKGIGSEQTVMSGAEGVIQSPSVSRDQKVMHLRRSKTKRRFRK